MAEAQERPPFNIVIREVVNKFLSKKSLNSSSSHGAKKPSHEPEPETLFDDSELFEGTSKAGRATDYLRVRDGNNEKCEANNDDEDDDAIFGEIETQVLRERHEDVKAISDERTEPTLESAFVTAAGKKTKVSHESLRAVKKKLEDASPPPTRALPPTDVVSGFRNGRAGSIRVSKKALAECEKVVNEVKSQQPPPECPRGNQEKVSAMPSSHEAVIQPAGSISTRQEAQALGFTTARGTVQKVSKEALKEIRKMFTEEFPDDDQAEVPREETEIHIEPGPSTVRDRSPEGGSVTNTHGAPLPGFRTARGTAQKVSEKALREVQTMFKDEFSEVSGREGGADELREETGFSTERARSPECSVTDVHRGSSLGFSAALGSSQKEPGKTPGEVRLGSQEASTEVTERVGSSKTLGTESKASMKSGFSTAKGKSVSVSKENLDRARKLLENAGANCENSERPAKNCAPSGSNASTEFETKALSAQKGNVQDLKTPARRFAGLKRRPPMCQTPLNRLSSPITPLRTPSSSSSSTPFRALPPQKHPAKKSRVLDDITEIQSADKTRGGKIKLTDLTLLNRSPAAASSTWFRDDVNGRRVHLEDVKRSFKREINVRSSNFDSWFANHFEMVVWKLANYSGRVKELAGCLIIENVLDQLKHRWNLEHDGKRSPLRMIAERDAPSESTMVLLVKDVLPSHLILTDGWYSLPCDVDVPLQALISRGTLRPGHKLCVCGAQLKGAPNGVDPLEPLDARLSLRFNSTRRARWFAKMGFVRRSLLVPLFSIVLDGGCLPAIRVRVSSTSPLMFFEKFSQGGSIMRQEAAEQKEQRKFCEKMSSILENIHEEVSRKLELEQRSKRVTRTRSRHRPSIASLKSGGDIFNALENSLDPSQIMENLSSSQRRMLESYRVEIEEKFRARLQDETRRRLEEMRQRHECPEERIVAPLLKLMVCCSLSNIEVPLTVWRPNEDLRDMLRVGATVTIYKANVTTCRKFPFGLTTKNNTTFEMYEESLEQQKPSKQPRRE